VRERTVPGRAAAALSPGAEGKLATSGSLWGATKMAMLGLGHISLLLAGRRYAVSRESLGEANSLTILLLLAAVPDQRPSYQ